METQEKVGNILIYLCQKLQGKLTITKLLKLVYLIDEQSVREGGVPVTWLSYHVWKLGPVAECVYLDSEREAFLQYIDFKSFSPKKEFDDGDFSDYELDLMNRIIDQYGNWSAKQLSDYTHREGSLWHRIVRQYKLEDKFDIYGGRTPYPMDMSILIEDDPMKLLAWKSAIEARIFNESLSQ